jgi:hypothetical protein
MSSDHTRRELVRTLSAAGLLGFLGGTGTYAVLTDGAIFEGSLLETGALDLEVAAASVNDASAPPPTAYADGETVRLSLPGLQPGDEGVVSVAVRSCDSPARVWLRTPLDATGPLAEALAVTLDAQVPGDTAEQRLFEGSLAGLTDGLADGTLLGHAETTADTPEYGDTAATCLGCAPGRLDLGWRLPVDAPPTVGGETATLELAFEARQCRHTTPENPW